MTAKGRPAVHAMTWDRNRLLAAVKRRIALSAAITVFHADVVVAWAAGVLCSIVAYGGMAAPLWMSAAMAVVVYLGVWLAAGPLFWGLAANWSVRIRRWGAPETVYSPPPPVDHVAELLASKPARQVPEQTSRSTEPRPLKPYELSGCQPCWRCGEPPVEGRHAWEDRGPYQLLSNHTFKCRNGHRWTNSTDGG
ncbi:hypothetical protein OHB13_38325 (plasmid) [Streptomyces sp. NBC_00440]|uniref:hypothetical protein n=1 Tax=Streptomyces sp. NBC_00440 TaxID=2975741 RepID=UPI002E1C0A47